MADGDGNDAVSGFEAPTDLGGGSYSGNDQLDVSGLTDASGNPINVDDVTVTDDVGDGTGNAILLFPGGESITLKGVTVSEVSSDAQLIAMGIPDTNADYIVEGTGGADLINTAYVGDPEGDMIDNNDHSDGSNDDSVVAGDGDDSIDAGSGDDTILGEGGDDEFFLDGAIQNDSIVGGETNEDGSGDRINFSTVSDDITIIFTGDEEGTLTDGTSTTTFSEIEEIQMGTGNDSVVGSSGAEDIIGNYGDDTILGGGGDDTIFSGFDDDSVLGGSGNDSILTSSGADTVEGGTGNDQIDVGAADGETDTVVMSDGDGTDVVSGFEAPTDLGGGAYSGNDQLDVSGLTDASGNPVNVDDVTVTDTNGDGSGDAVLNFPGGESITMVGILSSQVSDDAALVAMGIPAAPGDYIVEGTAAGEVIDTAYAGDPEGDMVDNNDHSDGSNDDSVVAGNGNDTILSGAGDDTVEAGDGNDSVVGGAGNDSLSGNAGSDSILGGAGDDTIDGGSAQSGPQTTLDWTTVTIANGDGTTTVSDGTNSVDVTITGQGQITTAYFSSGHYYLPVGGGTQSDSTLLEFDEEVQNVSFELFDIDEGSWDDQIRIIALDADGNQVAVSFSDLTHHTVSGNTIHGNANTDAGGSGSADAVTVNIAGPIVSLEIVYEPGPNDATKGVAGYGDLDFEIVIPAVDGDDTIDGGLGNDLITGDVGNDSILGGEGNDTITGDSGNDSLTGGEGSDEIYAGADDDWVLLAEGDTVYGEGGDDLFLVTDYGEAGTNNATVVGGETGETAGDTLDFQGLTHWDNITYSNTDPGVGGGMSGTAVLDDGSIVTFSEIENIIICFTAETRIATASGLREVQDLQAGDLVVTRDHGLQPVRWAGKRTVPAKGRMAPIRFEAGVVGNERALLVSPQHRMLIQGAEPNLLFGETEILASAKHLVNGGSVATCPGGEVTYVHILFDQHEIIYAEGAPSESFFPGDSGLNAVQDAAREELFVLFPELRSSVGEYGETARMCLRAHESRLLRLS